MAEKISLKDIDKLSRDLEKKNEKEDLLKDMTTKYVTKDASVQEETKKEAPAPAPASSGNVFDDLFAATERSAAHAQEEPVKEAEEMQPEEPEYRAVSEAPEDMFPEPDPVPAHQEDFPQPDFDVKEAPEQYRDMFDAPAPEPAPVRRQPSSAVGGNRRYEITFEAAQKGRIAAGYVGVAVSDKGGKDRLYVGNMSVLAELRNFPIVTRQHTSGDKPFGFKVSSEQKQGVSLPVVTFDYPEDKDAFTAAVVGVVGGRPVWQVRYGLSQTGAAKHESVVYPDSNVKVKNSLSIVTDVDGKLTITEL